MAESEKPLDDDEFDTLPPSQDPDVSAGIEDPPTHLGGILRKLGPGLIIAGSIVGSGELIATTKTGAQAGIVLLWLIIIGCVIKVFVQIELGRYTIGHGETTLSALNQVPGPRARVNWILWFWLAMMLLGIGQLGGIVGGVGQAAALALPITGDYQQAILMPSGKEVSRYIKWDDDINKNGKKEFSKLSEELQKRVLRGQEVFKEKIASLPEDKRDVVERVKKGETLEDPTTIDDKLWAALFAFITAGLLFRGRYQLIQNISTVLVVGFTFITIGNVISLQMTDQFHISMSQLFSGMTFGLPEAGEGITPVATALATFGIIGVGASELITYPYWCIEKGYAKYTGKRTEDEAWAKRARGWMKVMHYDAFASMIIYTLATIAFFMMGVAVLYNEGRDPDGMRMVSTLATAYVPVFGEYARWLFLIGAVAVLYSTFLAATAGNARMWTDAVKIFKLMDPHSEKAHDRALTAFSVIIPMLCLAVFCSGVNPVRAILLSGAMQALLLPMIGFGALYFRFTRTDGRIKPGPVWDALLLISFVGLFIAGTYGAYKQIVKFF